MFSLFNHDNMKPRYRMQFRPGKDWHCFVDGQWFRLCDLRDDHRLVQRHDLLLVSKSLFVVEPLKTDIVEFFKSHTHDTH